MKKNILLTICLLTISFLSFAGKLVLIPVTETHNLESLFNHNNLKIHYYCDDYVMGTTEVVDFAGAVVLDENAFAEVSAYAIVYCYESQKDEYLSRISKLDKILYSGDNFLIMKILSNVFMPAKSDGMVMIRNTEARLPVRSFDFPVVTEIDPFVQSLVETVNTDTLISYVQHLQDYGTRVYFKPKAYEAQDWLKSKYETLGLDASIHEFSAEGNWWGLPATTSGNVIAIQKGKVRPDEYIICGSHYDSFVPYSYDNCPGADDNATGTAGILEIARIFSQYEFESSIIYCNFSAEEVGLCGSAAYASSCYQQSMNIVGYFNIDMSGYLQSGSNMHIDLIHPTSAAPLATYYKNIANIYFPAIPVTSYPNLSGGDSDHTSFNQKGYMGIYPFEDRNNYSPYIHTTNDLIGPSVNTPAQVKLFTQISLASIATLAVSMSSPPPPIEPPTHCVAQYIYGSNYKIDWNAPETDIPVAYYNLYEDNSFVLQTMYLSVLRSAEDFDLHCFKVTAVYDIEGEYIESDFSNESCASMPIPFPINCHAQYLENENIQITWEVSDLALSLFQHYNVFRDDEIIAQEPGLSYSDTLTDHDLHCYKISAVYKIEDEIVESVFSNESCDSVPFVNISDYQSYKYYIYPNPTNGELRVEMSDMRYEICDVEIFDVYGRKLSINHLITSSSHHLINISHLPAGLYFVKIYSKTNAVIKKVIKL